MKSPPDQGEKTRMVFHYEKGSSYRVMHAHGVHGGLSPKGEIQMAIYSEKNPLPKRVVNSSLAEGPTLKIGPEICEERVIDDGVVRYVEVEVLMNIETAREIHRWLGAQIKDFESSYPRPAPHEDK